MDDSKSPFIGDFLDMSWTIPNTRGVERIPFALHSMAEDTVNALIRQKVLDLARDGKRVCGIPKRL